MWCIDSITGQGVCELRAWLVDAVASLPFMRERVPTRWLKVKEAVEKAQAKEAKPVRTKAEVISMLDLETRGSWAHGMSAAEAWEAVEFFSELGEWK
eukprot:2993297-Rhodomonas_salina.1